ncbi:hypothetical protein LX36DRAFT_265351 [Colletotrichum falcatum]|nr:hypothetical protein LX36DRAFT_265351 [Colletotrichum falcatum]
MMLMTLAVSAAASTYSTRRDKRLPAVACMRLGRCSHTHARAHMLHVVCGIQVFPPSNAERSVPAQDTTGASTSWSRPCMSQGARISRVLLHSRGYRYLQLRALADCIRRRRRRRRRSLLSPLGNIQSPPHGIALVWLRFGRRGGSLGDDVGSDCRL